MIKGLMITPPVIGRISIGKVVEKNGKRLPESTTQSHRSAIYYADLVVRTGLSLGEAITQAQTLATQRHAAGFDQAALDAAARLGFANGSFEDGPEEVAQIVEEFYAAGDALPTEADAVIAPSAAASALASRSQHGAHSPCAHRP